jgi:hypothetical protein
MLRTLLLTTDVAYNIRCFLSKSVFERPNVADTAADYSVACNEENVIEICLMVFTALLFADT